MKKMSVPLPPRSFSKDYPKITADRLINRTDIRTFIHQNNVTMDLINRDMLELLKYEEDALVCDQCPGLLNCPKKTLGFRFYLENNSDLSLSNYVAPCELLHQFQLITSKYIRRDYPDSWVAMRFSDVQLPRESIVRRRLMMQLHKIVHQEESKEIKGFYLFGPSGTGKSFILATFLNEFSIQGKKVAFIQVKPWIDEMRQLIVDNRGDLLVKRLSELARVDALVLDSIGKEKVTEWSRDNLVLELLGARSSFKGKRTFFTSSLSLDELTEHYHIDASSRHEALREFVESYCQIIKFPPVNVE